MNPASPQQAQALGVSTSNSGLLYFSSSLMKMNHREVYGPGFPKSEGQTGSVSSLTYEPRGLAQGWRGTSLPHREQAGSRCFLSPERVAKGALLQIKLQRIRLSFSPLAAWLQAWGLGRRAVLFPWMMFTIHPPK